MKESEVKFVSGGENIFKTIAISAFSLYEKGFAVTILYLDDFRYFGKQLFRFMAQTANVMNTEIENDIIHSSRKIMKRGLPMMKIEFHAIGCAFDLDGIKLNHTILCEPDDVGFEAIARVLSRNPDSLIVIDGRGEHV